jgi:hypothetical protein
MRAFLIWESFQMSENLDNIVRIVYNNSLVGIAGNEEMTLEDIRRERFKAKEH